MRKERGKEEKQSRPPVYRLLSRSSEELRAGTFEVSRQPQHSERASDGERATEEQQRQEQLLSSCGKKKN